MLCYAKLAGEFGKERNKMAWFGSSEWRGLNGKTTTKRFKLQGGASSGTEYESAKALHDAIVSAMDAITDATLQDKSISFVDEQYQIGVGDITQSALLNVWAEDPENSGDALAISQLYVPAPNVGIFVGSSGANLDIVDLTDAQLQAFVDAVAAGAFISDHEVIDTGTAVNGMENGRRVRRKSS